MKKIIMLFLAITALQSCNAQLLGNKIIQSQGLPIWNLSNLTFTATNTFGNDRPIGFDFSSDGITLISGRQGAGWINENTLSTAYDASTVDSGGTVITISEGVSWYGLTFYDEGSKLILQNETDLYQYSLSTAYDASTASYDSVSFSMPALYYDMWWSYDGYKAYFSNGAIYQYTASASFDISTLTLDGNSGSISPSTATRGMSISPDGLVLWTIDRTGLVYEFDLDVPFDVVGSTITSTGNSIDITGFNDANSLRATYDGSVITVLDFSIDEIGQAQK